MNNDGSPTQAKARQQIENALLEQLRQRQIEWVRASDQDRDAARQRFLDALHSVQRTRVLRRRSEESVAR